MPDIQHLYSLSNNCNLEIRLCVYTSKNNACVFIGKAFVYIFVIHLPIEYIFNCVLFPVIFFLIRNKLLLLIKTFNNTSNTAKNKLGGPEVYNP